MANRVEVKMLKPLCEEDTGLKWLQTLARSGLRRSHSAEADAIYVLAQRAHELDDDIQATQTLSKLHIPVPRGMWLWLPLLLGFGFLWALQKEVYEERLIRWMWSLIVLAILACWILFAKFFNEGSADLTKQRRKTRLEEERRGVMADILVARDACVQQQS